MCLNCDEAKSDWEAEMLRPSHAKLFPDCGWGMGADVSDEDMGSIEKILTRISVTKAESLVPTLSQKGPRTSLTSRKSFARRMTHRQRRRLRGLVRHGSQ